MPFLRLFVRGDAGRRDGTSGVLWEHEIGVKLAMGAVGWDGGERPAMACLSRPTRA